MPAKIDWLIDQPSDENEADAPKQQNEQGSQDFMLKRIVRISPANDTLSGSSATPDDAGNVHSPRLVSWPPSGLSSASGDSAFPEKTVVLEGPRVHIFSFKVDEDGMIEDERFVKSVRLSKNNICEEAAFSPDGKYIIVGDSAGFAHFLKADGDLLFYKQVFRPGKPNRSTFCAIRFTSVPSFVAASPHILMCSTDGLMRRFMDVNLDSIEKASNRSDLRSIRRSELAVWEGEDNVLLSADQYWTADSILLAVGGIGKHSVADIYRLSNNSEYATERIERFTPEVLGVEGIAKVVWDHFGSKLALLSTNGFLFLFRRTAKGFERLELDQAGVGPIHDFEFIPPDDLEMLSAEQVPTDVYVAIIFGDSKNKIGIENLEFTESRLSLQTNASIPGTHFCNLNAPSSGFAHIFTLQLSPDNVVLSLVTPTPEGEYFQSLTETLESLIANGQEEEAREFAQANEIPTNDIKCAEASVLSSRINNKDTGQKTEQQSLCDLSEKLEEVNTDCPTFVSETYLATFCEEHGNQQKLLEFALEMASLTIQEQSTDSEVMDFQDFIDPAFSNTIDNVSDAYSLVYFTLQKWRCWKELFSGSLEWKDFLHKELSSIIGTITTLESLVTLWNTLPYPSVAERITAKITEDRQLELTSSEVDVLTGLFSEEFTFSLSVSTAGRLEEWAISMSLKMAHSPTSTLDALLLMTMCLRGGMGALNDCLKPLLDETRDSGPLDSLRLLKSFRDCSTYEHHVGDEEDEERWDEKISSLSSDDTTSHHARSVFPLAWNINSIEHCLEREKLHQSTMNFLRECSTKSKSHWLQLLELFLLHFQHGVAVSLDQFQEMTLDGAGIAVLDGCQKPEHLRSHIHNHFAPFCRRHNVHADALLNSYVQELCSEAYEPGDTELEERIETVIRCIGSCSVRTSAAIEFLKVCIPPYSNQCYRLLNDIRRWDVSNVEDLSQQEHLMIIRDVLHQYRMTQVNLSDDVQAWTACCRMMSESCRCGTLLHSLAFSGISMVQVQALHTNFVECTVLKNQKCHNDSVPKKNRDLSIQISLLYPLVLKRWITRRRGSTEETEQMSNRLLSSFSKSMPQSLNEAVKCILGKTDFENEWLREFTSPISELANNGGYQETLNNMIMDSPLLNCLYDIDQHDVIKTAEEALQFCRERILYASSAPRDICSDIISSVTGLEQAPNAIDVHEFMRLNESLISLATTCIDLGESTHRKKTLSRWIDNAQRCLSLSSEFGIRPSFSFLEDSSLQEKCLTEVIRALCARDENRNCDKSLDFGLCHQESGRLKRILSLLSLSVPSVVTQYCKDAEHQVGNAPFVHTTACLGESIQLTQQGHFGSSVFNNLCAISKNMSSNSNSSMCREYVPSSASEVAKESLAACSDDDLSVVFPTWQQVETSEWVWRNSDLDESNNTKSLSSNDCFGSVLERWRKELRHNNNGRGNSSLSRKFFGSESIEIPEEQRASRSIDFDVYRKFRNHFTDTSSLLERNNHETKQLISWILSNDKDSKKENVQCLLDHGARQLCLRASMVKMPLVLDSIPETASRSIFSLLSSATFDSTLTDLDLCSAYLLHRPGNIALSSVRELLPHVIFRPESLASVATVGSRVGEAFGDSDLADICHQLQEHYCWFNLLKRKADTFGDEIRPVLSQENNVTSIEAALEEVRRWGQKHFVKIVRETCKLKEIVSYCHCYKLHVQSALSRVVEWILLDIRFQDSSFNEWKPLLHDVLEELESTVSARILQNALYAINPYDYERIQYVCSVFDGFSKTGVSGAQSIAAEIDRIRQLTLMLRNYRRSAPPLSDEVSQPSWTSTVKVPSMSDVKLWDARCVSQLDDKSRERLPVYALLSDRSSKILGRELTPSVIPKLLPLAAPLGLHDDFFYEELCKSMTKKFVIQRMCNIGEYLCGQFKDLCLDNTAVAGNGIARSSPISEADLYVMHPNSEVVAAMSSSSRSTTRGATVLYDSIESQFQNLQNYLLEKMKCCGGPTDVVKPVHLDDIVEQLEQIHDESVQLRTVEWIQQTLPSDRTGFEGSTWASLYSVLFSPELEVHCRLRSKVNDDAVVKASIPVLMQSEMVENLRKTVSRVDQISKLPTLKLQSRDETNEYIYVLSDSDEDLRCMDVCFYDPQSCFLDKLHNLKRGFRETWHNILCSFSKGEKCSNTFEIGNQWSTAYEPLLTASEEAGFAAGKLCFLALSCELHASRQEDAKENDSEIPAGQKPRASPMSQFSTMIYNAMLRMKLLHMGAVKHCVSATLTREVDGEQLVRSLLNDSADAALRSLIRTSISSALDVECDESFQMENSSISINLFELCEEIMNRRSCDSFAKLKERLASEWLHQEVSSKGRGSDSGQLSSLLNPCTSESMYEHARMNGEKVLFLILASDALHSADKQNESDSLRAAESAAEWLINAVVTDDVSTRKTVSYSKYMICHVLVELSRLHKGAYRLCRDRLEDFQKMCGFEADDRRKLSLCKQSLEYRLSPLVALRDLHWFMFLFREAGIDKSLDSAVSNSKVSFVKGIWRHHTGDLRISLLASSFATCFSLPLTDIVKQTYRSLVDQQYFRSAIYLGMQLVGNAQHQAWMETAEGFTETTTRLVEQSVNLLLEFHSTTHRITVPGDNVLATHSMSSLTPSSSCSSTQLEILDSINWVFSMVCFLIRKAKSQFSVKQLKRVADAFERCEPILTPQFMFALSLLPPQETQLRQKFQKSSSLAHVGRFLSVVYPRYEETMKDENLLGKDNVTQLARSDCWPAFVLCMYYFGFLERILQVLVEHSYWRTVIGTVKLVTSHFQMAPPASQRLEAIEATEVHSKSERPAWTSADQPAPLDWIASMPVYLRRLEALSHGVDQSLWQQINAFLYNLSQDE